MPRIKELPRDLAATAHDQRTAAMQQHSTELDRRAALSVGQLVHYDTISSGLVPCKIVDAQDDTLTLKVTGARHAYPRSYAFLARRGPFVIAR